MLGGPLDGPRRDEARAVVTENGAVDAALAVARDHATKASEALAGADELATDVTAGLRRLVDGLVSRES
jgi:geranylgeranyl pyrophosphate synthase